MTHSSRPSKPSASILAICSLLAVSGLAVSGLAGCGEPVRDADEVSVDQGGGQPEVGGPGESPVGETPEGSIDEWGHFDPLVDTGDPVDSALAHRAHGFACQTDIAGAPESIELWYADAERGALFDGAPGSWERTSDEPDAKIRLLPAGGPPIEMEWILEPGPRSGVVAFFFSGSFEEGERLTCQLVNLGDLVDDTFAQGLRSFACETKYIEGAGWWTDTLHFEPYGRLLTEIYIEVSIDGFSDAWVSYERSAWTISDGELWVYPPNNTAWEHGRAGSRVSWSSDGTAFTRPDGPICEMI